MEIHEALSHIGLNDKESKVYIALLQLGQASAYGVAHKSGLKKPTTYVILDELIKKALVRQIPRQKKAVYEAVSPEEVFALASERLELAKTALPELLSMAKKEVSKIRTIYFEGNAGITDAITYRLNDQANKEAVGFYASDTGISKEALLAVETGIETLSKKGVHLRGFIPTEAFIETHLKEKPQPIYNFKKLPYEKYSSTVSLEAVGDFVRIVDAVSPIPQAIIIENPAVAKTLREIFELVWEKNS